MPESVSYAVKKVAFPSDDVTKAAIASVAERCSLADLAAPGAQETVRAELLATAPALQTMVDEVRRRLVADCAVILTGTPAHDDLALVALFSTVGQVSLQQDDDDPDAARLVWDVRPADAMAGPASHGSKSTTKSPLHTDAVQVVPRDRILALVCLENSREHGAATVVQPLDDFIGEFSEDDRARLSEPVYTFSKMAHGKEQSRTVPILDEVVDFYGVPHPAIRYSEKSLEFALKAGHRPPAENQAALEHLHDVAHRQEDLASQVWLEPNEMLIFDNARVLHGRGEIRGGRRHLKRLRASVVPVS